jgi:hypothetical protein
MLGASEDGEVCTACVRASGLCQRHAKGVLPQLKEPSWYRDAHSGLWTEQKERAATQQSRHAGRAANKARRRGVRGLLAAIQRTPLPSAA